MAMLFKKNLFLLFFNNKGMCSLLKHSSEKGYLESWLIGGNYCQIYYPYCCNLGMFHKHCLASISSFVCERKFCWSRSCRDFCKAFAGNPGWKVLVWGAALRQIYAAFCLRADGACRGVGNTAFIGFVLFFSFGW